MRKEVAWFKDAIIYQLMIDRFAGVKNKPLAMKPEFCGGNIKAITEKIDYFKNLGINTILLSPFLEGTAYHGYHTTDFFNVDHRFGTKEDLNELIKTAHENNIKIIMDFVPNHCSNKHPFFVKAKLSNNSHYRKWFYFNKNNSDYLKFLDFKSLPKINLDYEDSRNYIISVARFWLDKGIDGLRLDHAIGPSLSFWEKFSQEINKSHPHVVLLGEVWTQGWKLKNYKTLLGIKNKLVKKITNQNNDSYMLDFVNILDGCLDFTFNKIMRKYSSKKINHQKTKILLQKHFSKFPKDFFLPTFLDNHDMERILFVANQDSEILKELANWQFKIKQVPIIYYGTEISMSQNTDFSSMKNYGDLLARQPMKWENVGNEMYNFYKLLIAQKNRRDNNR